MNTSPQNKVGKFACQIDIKRRCSIESTNNHLKRQLPFNRWIILIWRTMSWYSASARLWTSWYCENPQFCRGFKRHLAPSIWNNNSFCNLSIIFRAMRWSHSIFVISGERLDSFSAGTKCCSLIDLRTSWWFAWFLVWWCLGCGWTWWSLRSFPTWAILWFYVAVLDNLK